jgi:hypothetical protein
MPLSVSYGGQPVELLARRIAHDGLLTVEDLLYALNRQKTRILERTARGVDVNESPFAPYSTHGPYYFYPVRFSKTYHIGAFTKQNRTRGAAASRFAKKVGGSRTRLGVKYASYAAFKSALGRSAVDLMGPSAPHMLQAIVVKATSPEAGVVGIYGSEADRAEGHNVGAGRLPKREFFGWGPKDEEAMIADLEKMQTARLGKIL